MFEYLKKYKQNFPNRKFLQLIDKIYDVNNLEEAWKNVKANKGSAGVDKETIHDFLLQRNQYFNEM
jgi:hypothetical protein